MLAGERIKRLLVDFFFVAVPIRHPAAIRAELFLPATFGLHQRSAAVFAGFGTGDIGVAVDMGTNGAGRQTQLGSDHRRTVSLQPHIVDGDFILQSHSDTPSVMTAK